MNFLFIKNTYITVGRRVRMESITELKNEVSKMNINKVAGI